MSVIATIGELEAIYGQPNEASTVKVASRITPQYRVLIDKSPFAALATSGPEWLDCSPRGDLCLPGLHAPILTGRFAPSSLNYSAFRNGW